MGLSLMLLCYTLFAHLISSSVVDTAPLLVIATFKCAPKQMFYGQSPSPRSTPNWEGTPLPTFHTLRPLNPCTFLTIHALGVIKDQGSGGDAGSSDTSRTDKENSRNKLLFQYDEG